MEMPNLGNLSLQEDKYDLADHLSRVSLKEQARLSITWDVVLYADHDNDQFIFITGPVGHCHNLEGEYDWSRVGDLQLSLFYNDQLIYAELLYTSFPEIERWPVDFYNCANVHMLLSDFTLVNEGFIEVEHFENFLYDDSPGELTIFKDPFNGNKCKVPLIILK